MDSTNPPVHEQARFALIDEPIKSEGTPANSSPLHNLDTAPPAAKSPSASSQPIPSTEPDDSTTDMAASGPKPKKKGTASVAKKAPKRPKSTLPKKPAKKAKPEAGAEGDAMEDSDMGDESDNGPYCLCRGPDDHRWMICCETCDDWFHGECIKLDKDIGEALIEKFVCPNCTSDTLTTIYKKTCALGACRKAARISLGTEQSVFCSNEHAQMWWERMVSRLPKARAKTGLNDQLTQGEFMALLNSGLANVDEEGLLKLAKMPFQDEIPQLQNGDSNGDDEALSQVLTDEERSFLGSAEQARRNLGQETALCNHMLTLIELAQKRRRSVIEAGRFGEDICGYDYRLDTISARDAFAAFLKSPDGENIFKTERLGVPPREDGAEAAEDDDIARGMCERKRCKVHSGWQKMLGFGIKYQVRELANQAAEVKEEERVVREAAGERWSRKKAENNWVEVLDG